jgi:hypothetical protein
MLDFGVCVLTKKSRVWLRINFKCKLEKTLKGSIQYFGPLFSYFNLLHKSVQKWQEHLHLKTKNVISNLGSVCQIEKLNRFSLKWKISTEKKLCHDQICCFMILHFFEGKKIIKAKCWRHLHSRTFAKKQIFISLKETFW